MTSFGETTTGDIYWGLLVSEDNGKSWEVYYLNRERSVVAGELGTLDCFDEGETPQFKIATVKVIQTQTGTA